MDKETNIGRVLLILGASVNFAIAILHVGIVIAGEPAYLYFGAASLARLASAGSSLPAAATLFLAVIFAGFGFYALAGARLFPRLPLLTVGLTSIGTIYTLRGLILIPDLIGLVNNAGYPPRQTVFSAVALGIGVLYLAGTILQRASLRRMRR